MSFTEEDRQEAISAYRELPAIHRTLAALGQRLRRCKPGSKTHRATWEAMTQLELRADDLGSWLLIFLKCVPLPAGATGTTDAVTGSMTPRTDRDEPCSTCERVTRHRYDVETIGLDAEDQLALAHRITCTICNGTWTVVVGPAPEGATDADLNIVRHRRDPLPGEYRT